MNIGGKSPQKTKIFQQTCFAFKYIIATCLLNFLLQRIKLRCVKELSQSNVQTVTDHLDRKQLRVLALAVQNIFNAGWG